MSRRVCGLKLPRPSAEAGQRLLEIGALKDRCSLSRSLELRPNDRPALSGIVSASHRLGHRLRSAELLEKVLPEKPDEVEFMELLFQAYLAAQDAPGAERATSLLMANDASNYTRFLDVARLYLQNGEVNEAARVLSGVTERVLSGREENQLLELVEEVLARDPEQLTALRLLVRIHWWQRDMDKLRGALERLTEAAEAAGETEDERYALTQLVRLVPDATRYAERLRELGGAQEEFVEEATIASPTDFEEVPTFGDFAIVKDDSFGAPPAAVISDHIEMFETHSAPVASAADPSASFADLNDDFERGGTPGSQVGSEFATGSGYGEIDFTSTIPEPEADSLTDDEGRHDAMLRQELESVDFYIAQGYLDIAVDTLDMLEKQYQSHPEIESRRQQITQLNQPGAPKASIIATEEVEVGGPAASSSTPEFAPMVIETPAIDGRAPQAVIDAGLADIFEEFRSAEEAEVLGTDDYETHYNMGLAYKDGSAG